MGRSLVARLRLIAATLVLFANSIASAAGDESDARYVKVKHAVALRVAPDRNALAIEYEYRFAGFDKVHIDGLGTVPAQGSFKYITEASSLVFSDVSNGKMLSRVELKETVAVAAKPPLNKVPADEEFDPSIRVFRWTSGDSFSVRAGAVLGK